jgi:ATP-binding cassette subfamily B protein RaxB
MNVLAEQFNAETGMARLSITHQCANALIFGAERITIIWLAALAVIEARFSIGMLFAFISYQDQFSQRLAALIDRLCELQMLRLHGERLADIVLTESEPVATRAEIDAEIHATDIELRNIAFRYADGEPYVIRNLNLRLPAGQCLAITGASGCGKTTLIKLLLGLHQPTSGEILVGGVSLQQLGLGNYRPLVAAVLQDDQLFSGSITDNISFFDPCPDQQRIALCARQAAIHADICCMPMAYNTLLGDTGSGLSGGQKQRLLLARALYKEPRVLVLDEATSHLDSINEQLVNAAIGQIPLTRIVVAHRAETIAMAQRVVVLHDGQIADDFQPRSDPVHEHEQDQPDHVHEVPVPGHGFKTKMAGGREMAAHAP